MNDPVSQDAEKVDRELTVDGLVSGDRPSVFFLGMVGAHAIRKDQMAVFMVDVLGRVHLMPPSAIRIVDRPRVKEEELNALATDEAIQILVQQGDSEEEILKYLARRGPQHEEE